VVLLLSLITRSTLAYMEFVAVRHVLKRSLFHIIAGSLPAVALFIFPRLVVQIALAVVTVLLLSFEVVRLRISSLNEWFSSRFAPLLRKEEEGQITGSSYLLVGYLVTVLIFPQSIAALAILFASLGDPAATLIGTWKGRIRLWGKSIEGDVACLIVCLCVGVLIAILLGTPSLIVVITGAILATIFQALPLRLNDNLIISFVSAAGMMVVSILV
jgi:dolichol kinase